MKNEIYCAPAIEMVEVASEEGFALSYTGGDTDDGGAVTFDDQTY